MMWFQTLIILTYIDVSACTNIWEALNIQIERNAKYNQFRQRTYIWNITRQDFISLSNESWVEHLNMNALAGEVLNIVTFPVYPYLIVDNETKIKTGLIGDMWNIFEEFLHFRTNLSVVPLNIAIDSLSDGLAVVTLTPILSSPWIPNVEFSQPYFFHNSFCLFTKLPAEVPDPLYFLRTLTTKVWYISLGVFLFLAIYLFVNIRLLNNIQRRQGANDIEPSLSIVSCLMLVTAGFFNQGIDMKINSLSARLLFLIALLFGYLLYSSISAILVSQIAIFDFPTPYHSLDDIVEMKISICVRNNSHIWAFMKQQAEFNPAWGRVLNGPGCPETLAVTTIKESICTKNVMFFEAISVMSAALATKWDCTLLIIDGEGSLFKQDNSLMLYKGFKQKKLIHFMLEKIRCNGILKKLLNSWIIRIIYLPKQRSYNDVTFQHVQGILILYASTILFSIIVFIVECIIHKIHVMDPKIKQN